VPFHKTGAAAKYWKCKSPSHTTFLVANVTTVTCLWWSPAALIVKVSLMFIRPCIIVIVEELKTNLMSLAFVFHFLCAQHVSDINISIIRSLRLCCSITTSVILFSVRCVLEIWCGWVGVVSVLQASACNTGTIQPAIRQYSNPVAPNLQNTTNREENDRCGN